jgi:hypothetical protein
MGKLRYTMPAGAADPVRLREDIRRYWRLLDRNDDPSAVQALKQLIVEAEARLANSAAAS